MIIVAGSHTEILEDTVKHLADARMGRKRHTTTAYTLDEIEWSNPGVVITNLKFEGIEGIEFVGRIRRKNKKQYREVPILALIEDATRDRIIDLLKAGVSDILLCPTIRPICANARCTVETRATQAFCARWTPTKCEISPTYRPRTI